MLPSTFWIMCVKNTYHACVNPLHTHVFVGVYILIAAGALMMVVGFLGCCGAIQESPCMLGLVCTTCLLIIQLFPLILQFTKNISTSSKSS